MNKELLLKVADAIEVNPNHFDMAHYFDKNECGTTACIAGWALYLDSGLDELKTVADEWDKNGIRNPFFIRQILQLECEVFYSLAAIELWINDRLRDKYLQAKTPKQKAKAAAAYVRWFVKNSGKIVKHQF